MKEHHSTARRRGQARRAIRAGARVPRLLSRGQAGRTVPAGMRVPRLLSRGQAGRTVPAGMRVPRLLSRGQAGPRKKNSPDSFWDLVATARHLQGPGGCAWDRAQTFESLYPHLLEETWEVLEAFRARRRRHLQEELGDVLYTVLFLTLILERKKWLSLDDLLQRTAAKMVRRHPHVFTALPAPNPSDAYAQWQSIKKTEKKLSSRGNALRPLLMEVWDLLHRDPDTAKRLARWVRRRAASERPRRRRASSSPARDR